MRGPEHYREAERQLTEAEDLPTGHLDLPLILAQAQVHATLALTAATAATQASEYDGDEDHGRSRGWAGVV